MKSGTLKGFVQEYRAKKAIFKTAALTLGELAPTLALSSLVFFAVEIEKWLKRRRG